MKYFREHLLKLALIPVLGFGAAACSNALSGPHSELHSKDPSLGGTVYTNTTVFKNEPPPPMQFYMPGNGMENVSDENDLTGNRNAIVEDIRANEFSQNVRDYGPGTMAIGDIESGSGAPASVTNTDTGREAVTREELSFYPENGKMVPVRVQVPTGAMQDFTFKR